MPDNLPAVASPQSTAVVSAETFMPVMDVTQALQRRNAMVEVAKRLLAESTDFGKIPGVDKPTLLQPGAEKLISFFGLSPTMECIDKIEDWDGKNHGGEPFFYYRYRCTLRRGDLVLGSEEASCNSRETKYRYRWVPEDKIPAHLNRETLAAMDATISELAFAIAKGETSGKYGKPAEYWARFNEAIKKGTAKKVQRKTKTGMSDAYEIPGTLYRIPNPEIADQVNTIQQMAEKRAKIRAVRSCTGASEFFTQDVEDMAVIDITPTAVEPTTPSPQPSATAGTPPTQPEAAAVGTAPKSAAQVDSSDDAQLALIECTSLAQLTEKFNAFPADWKRPGSRLYELFQKRRGELMPKGRREPSTYENDYGSQP